MVNPQTTFSLKSFLSDSGAGKSILPVRKGSEIFTQGDKCDALYYIQQGRVKISVLSDVGKEATLAVLSPGDFAGEEIVSISRLVRSATAVALTDCVLLRIQKGLMLRKLQEESALSEAFIAYLLVRGERLQADLADHFFNKSEKRLARTLMLLANFSETESTEMLVPQISQEALAMMIGCTRSRVNIFLNRFRKLGYIQYDDRISVNKSLSQVVAQD
jgi:CRP/FNR family cyclic AMP-dependent transcriptional regulator